MSYEISIRTTHLLITGSELTSIIEEVGVDTIKLVLLDPDINVITHIPTLLLADILTSTDLIIYDDLILMDGFINVVNDDLIERLLILDSSILKTFILSGLDIINNIQDIQLLSFVMADIQITQSLLDEGYLETLSNILDKVGLISILLDNNGLSVVESIFNTKEIRLFPLLLKYDKEALTRVLSSDLDIIAEFITDDIEDPIQEVMDVSGIPINVSLITASTTSLVIDRLVYTASDAHITKEIAKLVGSAKSTIISDFLYQGNRTLILNLI